MSRIPGGPGDDHQYLRRVAAPLTGRFRCVLLDHRGIGRSSLHSEDGETITAERRLVELERLPLVKVPVLMLYGTRSLSPSPRPSCFGNGCRRRRSA